jgi:putative DNA primase/helicase
VPFIHKPVHVDKQLEEKLRPEWPGILRWIIDGCLTWQRDGLARPKAVDNATEEYFEEQDLMRAWVEECCETGRACSDTSASLFKSWTDYALASGEKPGSKKRFSAALFRLGFRKSRTNRSRNYDGIRLKVVHSFHQPEADRA